MSRHPANQGRPPIACIDRSGHVKDEDLAPREWSHLVLPSMPKYLVDPSPYLRIIRDVTSITTENLIIYFYLPIWPIMLGDCPASRWDTVQKFLGAIYGEAAQMAAQCDRPDMAVSVYFEGSHRGPLRQLENEDQDDELRNLKEGTFVKGGPLQQKQYNHQLLVSDLDDIRDKYYDGDFPHASQAGQGVRQGIFARSRFAASSVPTGWIETLLQGEAPQGLAWDGEFDCWDMSIAGKSRQEVTDLIPQDSGYDSKDTYNVVALGGTFDHLHAGHKVLLTMGIFLAAKKLIIGVSSDELLRNKKHANLIEPLETRIAKVRGFVTSFNRCIEYYIVPINDVYGPTATDDNIQALVLSTESAQGGEMVAEARKNAGLSTLKTFTVDVVHSKPVAENLERRDGIADVEELKELKMGSSHIRAWLAKGGRKEEPDVAKERTEKLLLLERLKAAEQGSPRGGLP